MPKIARFQLPDGRIARFSVPDEATPEQAQAMMSSYFAGSQQQPQQTEPEDIGILHALGRGAAHAVRDTAKTGQLGAQVAGYGEVGPEGEEQPKSIAEMPMSMKDVTGLHFYDLAKKAAYGLGKSSPTIAGAVLGARALAPAGVEAGALVPGAGETGVSEAVGGGLGLIAGTGLGAAAGSALQTIGPYYAKALKEHPGDPNAAYEIALKEAAQESAITGAAFAAFEFAPFKSQIKNLLMQAFGVQPAISMAGKAATNVISGKDVTEGITPEAYGESVLGTVAPLAAMKLGAAGLGKTKELAGKAIGKLTETKDKFKYMKTVEGLAKQGLSLPDAEKIATTAEQMEKSFNLSPEQALEMARKQWETDNAERTTTQTSAGESGGPDATGSGVGVPVPSTETGAAGVAGKPTEAGTVGLVPSDTGATPIGGREGRVEPPLDQQLSFDFDSIPTTAVPEVTVPEAKTPEVAQEEFNFEQPETTAVEPVKTEETKVEEPAVEPVKTEETKVEEPVVEPVKTEETKVEEPAVEPTVEPTVEPAKTEEPSREPTTGEPREQPTTKPIEEPVAETPAEPKEQTDTYDRAVEAVSAQAQHPERVITPAYIAKQVGISLEEAKVLLDKLHVDGVVGAKRGAFGYEQVKAEEEIPVAEQSTAPVAATEAPTVDANARKAELRSKIEQAFEDDVITEDQYRESMLALQKGTGISRKVLQLIGDKEAPVTKVETPAQPVAERKAPRDLTDEEFNAAHMALNNGEDLSPELLDALGVDPRTLPTTRVDQNTGKVNISGLSPRESTVLLRERLDAARENLGLSKTAYSNIARDIDAGRDLSQGTLDLLGVTQGLSPAEGRARYLREVLNKKRRDQEAARVADEEGIITGDTPEAKIEQLAAAKARYTTTVLQMAAKLLETKKISRYEHAALVNEVTKENPNREVIAKLLASFKKRTKEQEPVRLPIDEKDAAELIVKRLDAKEKKAGPRVMAAKARPKVVEGKDPEVEEFLKDYLTENTPNEVSGTVYGESSHHPEWATKALEDSRRPEAIIIYSDGDLAIYRGNILGRKDYGVITRGTKRTGTITSDRGHVLRDTNVEDYFNTHGKRNPNKQSIMDAIHDYEVQEVANERNVPDGPFQGKEGQVVKSESVDKRYANLLSSLMNHLNIGKLRVFLFHPEDVKGLNRHLYGLYGDKYANIDLIKDEEFTFGYKVDIGERVNGTPQGKDFAIMLKPGMSERLTVEVLTHELGHVIEDVAYHTASPEVKAAIKSEYDKWFKKSYEVSPLDVLNSLKLSPEFTQDITSKDVIPGERVGDRAHDEYVRSFPEWWADNVARWMNTAAEPVSVIDKFFKSVATQLRKLIQAVTGKPLPPNKAVASFLEDMRIGRRDYVADFLGQKLEVPPEFNAADIFSTGYDASKVPPRILKAAIPAKDANQRIAEAEEKFELSDQATNQVDAVQQALKDRDPAKFKEATDIYIDGLSGKARDNALSMLPTSWVIDRVEKILPSLRQAGNLLDLVAGSKDRMHRAFSKMSQEINKFVTTNGQKTIGKVISLARLHQVSAYEWGRDTTLAEIVARDTEAKAYRDRAAATADPVKKAEFEAKAVDREKVLAEMHSVWNELGRQEGGQEMYKRIMSFYRNAHTVVHSLLSKDIESIQGLTAEERAIIKEQADKAYDIMGKGELDENGIFRRTSVESYFPWRRFGDYWLRVNKGEGEFYTFDSITDREAFVRERAKQLGVSHDNGEMFQSGNDLAALRGLINKNNMSPILQNMLKVIDKAHGARGISLEKIKDDLVQMWLLTLPERSIRRQFIHSGDITGMSTDIVRVFNDTANVYANQIAKLQYGNRVRQQINAARDAIEPIAGAEENLSRSERQRLEAHINVVDRRAEEFINPPERNQIVTAMNHFAHFYYLSSPSHFLRNLLSVPMRTMPKLNSMYGYGSSFGVAMRYMKIFNSFKFEENGQAMAPSIKDSKMLRDDPIAAQLFEMGLDRNAMSGQGREIIRHDLAASDKAGRVFRAVYDASTALFDASERISREMAYMMQAELAYKKYTKQGKTQAEALELAANEAAAGVKSAIGDFSEFERPDFMRTTGKFGDASRALFMFKMWGISQAKFFMTYADKVFRGKGLTTSERIEAAHELGGSLAMAAIMGGAFGLPAISTIFAAMDYLDKLFVSDDDPEKKKRRALNPLLADSAEARFRYEWLPKHFGKVTVPGIDGKQHSLSQVIAQGPVSALSGVDIGAKTSYNNLFFRNPEYSSSYVGAAASFMQNNLGPDVSIGINFAEAVDNYDKGQYLRAVTNLVPSLGKGFISAYRLETEGAVTSKGIPILGKNDLTQLGKLSTAVGFTPTALTDAYNRSSMVHQELERMNDQKTEIKNKFIQAILKHGDMKSVFEEIKKFNARYPQPQFMLTADQLMGAIGNYQKTYATSMYGVNMPKPEDWMYATWYMKDRYK